MEVKGGPSYRVKPDDDVIQVTNPGPTPITIYLPSGFEKGKLVTVKDKGGNSFEAHINIISDAGKIDGLREYVIAVDKGSVAFIWDGDAWSVN